MRYAPALLVASAAIVYAESAIDTRNLCSDSLNHISMLTQNVSTLIQAVSGSNISSAIPVENGNTDLVGYIDNATTIINNDKTNLTEDGAEYIAAPTQALAYSVNSTIALLISKKSDFENLTLTSLVITSLQQQLNASNIFAKALLAKVPADLLPVANILNDQVIKSINQGIDCFSGKNETCNPTPANSTRTVSGALRTGAERYMPGLVAVPYLNALRYTVQQYTVQDPV